MSDGSYNRGSYEHGEGSINTECEIRLHCHRCALKRTRPHTNGVFKKPQRHKHTSRTLALCLRLWVRVLYDIKVSLFHSSLSNSASHRPWESCEHFTRTPQHFFEHPSHHGDDRKGDNMAAASPKPRFVQWSVALVLNSALRVWNLWGKGTSSVSLTNLNAPHALLVNWCGVLQQKH